MSFYFRKRLILGRVITTAPDEDGQNLKLILKERHMNFLSEVTPHDEQLTPRENEECVGCTVQFKLQMHSFLCDTTVMNNSNYITHT